MAGTTDARMAIPGTQDMTDSSGRRDSWRAEPSPSSRWYLVMLIDLLRRESSR